MMGVAEALANTVTDSKAIYLDTQAAGNGIFRFLQHELISIPIGKNDSFVINNMVILAAVTIVIIILLFNKTGFGGRILAIGHSKRLPSC